MTKPRLVRVCGVWMVSSSQTNSLHVLAIEWAREQWRRGK